jgi:creatinine amidohydrolase/Fe(II)-dependent formamide hydrolase-like protein
VTTVRVYVPSSLHGLRRIVAANGIGPAPLVAHAVTDALREAYADGGEEEWEYAAASAAAQSSLSLLAADEPARRVVLAVDVPRVRAADPDDPDDPTVVRVEEEVPLRWIGAVLVDAADAEADVAAARDAVAAGSSQAESMLERCLDHELGWWATQEIGALLDEAVPQAPPR